MAENARLLSVDALRGFTIAAMIVVNTPGSWSHVYSPLLHADWHGLTPTDLVFPFFLFLVGVSTALSTAKLKRTKADPSAAQGRMLIRALKIFAVGVFLNLWPGFDFETMRWAGVLQRIGLVFAIVSILYLRLSVRKLSMVAAVIMLGYWALLAWVPVPKDPVVEEAMAQGTVERAHGARVEVDPVARGEHTINPNVEPGINIAAWFDRAWLPGAMYERTWDPEGWLSTLPSIATALIGAIVGATLLAGPASRAIVYFAAATGGCFLLVGYLWGLILPINKNLWTSSYVLVSAGWSIGLLAAAMWWVDIKGRKGLVTPFLAFGSNAITAYVVAAMLTAVTHQLPVGGSSLVEHAMERATADGATPKLASLLCALGYTALVFVPILYLYRRKVFFRL